VGVSPSSAFRHYIDKRALLTAFATRALYQLSDAMESAKQKAQVENTNALYAVGLAYIDFALEKPALFRAMWREEAIYARDDDYVAAADKLSGHLKAGFADTIQDDDPTQLSHQELLVWSCVHGLANLYVDGPVAKDQSNAQKLKMASDAIRNLEICLI
jgi:AcrR family transcriptional regulator